MSYLCKYCAILLRCNDYEKNMLIRQYVLGARTVYIYILCCNNQMGDLYSPYAVDPTSKQSPKIFGNEKIDWNQEDWNDIMASIMDWDCLSRDAFQFDQKLQRCKSLKLDCMKKYYDQYPKKSVEPVPEPHVSTSHPRFVFEPAPEIRYRAIDWH